MEGQQVEMPKAGETITLNETDSALCIYADFECVTVPNNVKRKTAKAETKSYQNHRPCGFMINVLSAITGGSEPYLCRVAVQVMYFQSPVAQVCLCTSSLHPCLVSCTLQYLPTGLTTCTSTCPLFSLCVATVAASRVHPTGSQRRH